MNIDQFLSELSSHKELDWELDNRTMRCSMKSRRCCPITALANLMLPPGDLPFSITSVSQAGNYLELEPSTRRAIVKAADKLWSPRLRDYSEELRVKLLEAVGLEDD